MKRPTPIERVKELKKRFSKKETRIGMVEVIIERSQSDLDYWNQVLTLLKQQYEKRTHEPISKCL